MGEDFFYCELCGEIYSDYRRGNCDCNTDEVVCNNCNTCSYKCATNYTLQDVIKRLQSDIDHITRILQKREKKNALLGIDYQKCYLCSKIKKNSKFCTCDVCFQIARDFENECLCKDCMVDDDINHFDYDGKILCNVCSE